MSLRRAKQIIYAGFFIGIWYVIIAGGYHLFVKPEPTCFDNIQNQNEAGVDCGGVCAKVCIPAGVQSITLVPGERVISFQTDATHISFLAHVENPNVSYGTKDFVYHFSLYDDQGTLVQSFSGNSFIYAGELKYILLPHVNLPKYHFSKVDFTVDTPVWIPKSQFDGPPQIAVSGITPGISSSTVTVSGQATNNDTIIFPAITIVAIFPGQFGQVAAVSQTEIEDLAPNRSAPFSVIYPFVTNINFAAVKVYAYAARP
ncbi:MAG: hypothetical protein Q8P49_00930 [Candidatus Liptonbacteria bacterium]|nr:hypothetical protein [Candidatus Liptonbacteria bacterium]